MLRYVAIVACLAAASQGALRPQNLPAAFRNNPDLPAFTGKIVGGTEAEENSIPYQVLLLASDLNRMGWLKN